MAPATRSVLTCSPLRRGLRTTPWLAIAAVLVWAVAGGWAEDPKTTAAKEGKPAAKKEKPALIQGLDKFKLPPNAIVVICESFAEGRRLVPKGWLLSNERYQALLDRINELERKLKPEAPAFPSACKLKVTGSLDGDSVRLEAEFRFDRKKTRVALGCQGANPRKAELDGKEALLENGDDGYVIQLDPDDGDKGEHVLTLQMNLPIVSRGGGLLGGENDRGFELTLPRAALTSLELERLPTGVKEVRCNDGTIAKAGDPLGLGPAKQLTVFWKKTSSLPGTGPLLTADGKITVRVEKKLLLTEAELTLRDERGLTKDWILAVPAQATVEFLGPLDDRAGTPPTVTFDKAKQEHVIHLKEASAEPVRVVIRAQRPLLAPGRMSLGPWLVRNAGRQPGAILVRQRGTILITEPPAGIFLSYHKPPPARVNLSQKEDLTDEQKRARVVAAFDYRVPAETVPSGKAVPESSPLLDLDVRPVQGVVETTVKHTLRLEPAEQGWQIQAVSEIVVEPRRASVRALEVQLPRDWPEPLALLACWRWPQPGILPNLTMAATGSLTSQGTGIAGPVTGRYQLDRNASLTDRVENIRPADAQGRVQILLTDKKEKKFTLDLKGVYTLSPGDRRAILELPRLLNTLDRGSKVEIVVPDGQEFSSVDAGHEPLGPARHMHTMRPARSRVEVAWRPYRPDLAVKVVTDVTFRHSRAHVEQRVQFPPQQQLPAQVHFRLLQSLPLGGALGQSLRLSGGKLEPDTGAATETSWPVTLALDKSRTLILNYQFPVSKPQRIPVPLLWLDQATRIDTKVRVWSDPEVVPRLLEGGRWHPQETEVVPERIALPQLVLSGLERHIPLTLQLGDAELPTLATALVERGLIRAVAMPGGGQTYRARFLVSTWNTSTLGLELPTAASGLSIRLDGKLLTPRKASAGTSYWLDIEPDHYPRPVILDIAYQVAPGEGDSDGLVQGGFLDNWRTVFHPPVLRGAVFLGRVRWQVQLPSGQVVLNPGNEAILEQEWGLRGWLLAPQATVDSSDLENWLSGSNHSSVSEHNVPSLVCWQARPRPLHLIHVPQKTWLLVWSFLCLAVGLGLSFVPLSRGPFRLLCWSVAALTGLAALITALLWPNVMPAILYGCEPGVAILVLVLAIQWMLQSRYRRRLIFMPGFTRLKPGSSLVRAGSSNRPREPSTVDVPPVPESAAAPRSS
jgi:hypothetical protein